MKRTASIVRLLPVLALLTAAGCLPMVTAAVVLQDTEVTLTPADNAALASAVVAAGHDCPAIIRAERDGSGIDRDILLVLCEGDGSWAPAETRWRLTPIDGGGWSVAPNTAVRDS